MALIESGLADQLKDDLEYNIHFDNKVHSYTELLPSSDPDHRGMKKPRAVSAVTQALSQQVYDHAKEGRCVLTLGGDHSIALPTLRALNKIHGPIAVLHLDAHLDTWHPAKYPSAWIDPEDPAQQSFFTHGTMFWLAHNESLIAKDKSVHAGLRTRLSGPGDNDDDDSQGWKRFSTDDMDDIGADAMAAQILKHIGTETPVYLSIDIDVIDPGLAPGTGTPEPGGWSTREVIRLLRRIEGLNVVGADVVEVSPAFDGSGETTALAAAQVAFEILTSMVKRGMGEAKGKSTSKDEL